MAAPFPVDLISDLNLTAEDDFNWEGKPTSLFCAIAGGISRDTSVIRNTLEHLSSYYRGVMYIDGSLEHHNLRDYETRVEELREICRPMTNVVYMHNHVVILNSVAFVACNGWFHNDPHITELSDALRIDNYRMEDLAYLSKTIKTLQVHNDAHRIVVISSSVPAENLLYNKVTVPEEVEPGLALLMDTESKTRVWMYGGTRISVDQNSGKVHYVNNPCIPGQPYWPKHVIV